MSFKYKEFLKKQGLEYINYILPLDNLQSFINNGGILSRNRMISLEISFSDISLSKFQEKRKRVLKNNNNIDAHDYVPLYFATHTPMLWIVCVRNNLRSSTLILKIKLEILETADFFSDMNCSSTNVDLYTEMQDLDKLRWDIIVNQTPDSRDWSGKTLKAAEVLVKDKIDLKYIDKIIYHRTNSNILKYSSDLRSLGIEISLDDKEFY